MGVSIGDFDLAFVALSFLFSVLGSGLALLAVDIASRTRGLGRNTWATLSGVLLGGVGIWAMHFIGMLAYQPGVEIVYQYGPTVLSVIPAIAATTLGVLIVVNRYSIPRLFGAGVLVATGVVAMHYTGMAAMTMPMAMSYSLPIVGASVAVALVAATAALWLAVTVTGWVRFASAVVMGIAVCGMHYTGMAAMRLGATQSEFAFPEQAFSQFDVTVGVTGGAFALLLSGAIAVGVQFLRVDPVLEGASS